MEWIDGPTLRQWLANRQQRPLEIGHALSLIGKLAAGLQAAHDIGILHRDIKPDNVMMRGDDDPVIVDFGLARWFDRVGQSLLTIEGSIVGSPAYMSPEQIVGLADNVGPASDLYGLGVLLFELLTGQLPFDGDGIAVLFKAANDPVPSVQERRPDIDSTLASIVQKALAKEPVNRFASVAMFASVIDRYARGETIDVDELKAAAPLDAPQFEAQSSSAAARPGWIRRLTNRWR
jgi:serine/threonine protein kinase